jgi:hypothetical protein
MILRSSGGLSKSFQSKSVAGVKPLSFRCHAERGTFSPLEFFGLKKTTESSVSSWLPRVITKIQRGTLVKM